MAVRVSGIDDGYIKDFEVQIDNGSWTSASRGNEIVSSIEGLREFLLLKNFYFSDQKNHVIKIRTVDNEDVRDSTPETCNYIYQAPIETFEKRDLVINNGKLTFYSIFEERNLEIILKDETGFNDVMINADINFYDDNDLVFITGSPKNPSSNYLPFLYVLDKSSTQLAGLGGILNIKTYLKNKWKETKDLAVKFFPEYNEILGSTKTTTLNKLVFPSAGNWSFDDINKSNILLNRAGLILIPTVIFSEVGIPLVAATIKGDEIINYMGQFTDAINSVSSKFNYLIDWHKRVKWFRPSVFGMGSSIVSLPTGLPFYKVNINDIKQYLEVNQGDWRIYENEDGDQIKVEVNGYKNFDGVNVPKIVESGGISYQGYDGDKFQTWAFEIPDIGLVKFDPPVVVGDNNLYKGKTYITNSSIVFGTESFFQKTAYTYQDLKRVDTPLGRLYLCWEVKNVSEAEGNSMIQYAWFAPKFGQVQMETPYGNYLIKEAYIKGRHYFNADLFLAGTRESKFNPKKESPFGLVSISNLVK